MKIKQKKSRKMLVIIIVCLVLICLGVAFFIAARVKHPHYKTITTHNGSMITADPNVPGGSNNPTSTQSSTGAVNNKDPGTSTAPTLSSSTKPSQPLGEFVSNHRPNLSGTPAPNTESSTCTTTPGAKCEITFTNGSVTKKLPSQLTDSDGNTTWSWTLQEIGITEGTWKINAIATNGNLISSTPDATALEVQP